RRLGEAGVDPLVRRHSVVMAAVSDDDVALVHRSVVSRVEGHPARRRRVELDPRVTLRGLTRLALDVQVAAHVAAGNLAQPEQAEHQVSEVLTDAAADLQEVLGLRVLARATLPVLAVLL